MRYRVLAALTATAITATAFSTQADARTKKRSQYRGEQQTPSLDGRITGRPRTCGYETFQYDNDGVPYGPYCH
jgi:hypothetical protein